MSFDDDKDFAARREKAMASVQLIDKDRLHDMPEREAFFEEVYDRAEGDAAAVPWADLAAKDSLSKWLAGNPNHHGHAVDVGCGLGDNAEALSAAGYTTMGFDFSPKAIAWAKQRFGDSDVQYCEADLFNLPDEWIGKFDLVHECYTLQSIPPETLARSIPAVASLVAHGGILLVYSRIREDDADVDGPPWPLEATSLMSFANHGLKLVSREEFTLERPDKSIPHAFCAWEKM